nr:MAG TPA: chromosome replication initiation protein [Caudoviricetes sp.]
MAEIRPFVLLQDWMFDLGLNPSEVIAVAVIYGFTQDGQHTCHASIDYFGRMCKLKRRATVYMLRRLEKMGIVRRVETLGKINEYSLDLEGCKNCTRAKIAPVQKTTKTRAKIAPLSPLHPPIPDNKDNNNITSACDAHVCTHEDGSEPSLGTTPQPPSPPVPSRDKDSLFYVSSVMREWCGFDPDRIAEVKRKKMSEALDRAAARLESEGLRMSPEQRARFLDHWCAHRPGSEAIRAEGDPYFSMYAKAKLWTDIDAQRAAAKTAAGGESKFMDATSDWKNRGDF